jgi:hypothetical protein
MKWKRLLIVSAVILAIVLLLTIKAVLFFGAEPNIAINYIVECNKISRPENYDPNQNAFFDYQKAADSVVKTPKELLFHLYPPLDFYNYLNKYPGLADWPGDMNDSQLKILNDWLSENTKALEYYKQGSQKLYCWYEAPENIGSMMKVIYPNFSEIRTCALALCWRSQVLASENKLEQAFDDLLTCDRTGRLFFNQKTTIEQLFGMGIQGYARNTAFLILDKKKIEGELLGKFQKDLEKEIACRRKTLDFTIGKFSMYEVIQLLFSDDGKGNGHLIPREVNKSFLFEPKSIYEFIRNVFTGLRNNGGEHPPKLYWLALTGPDRRQYTQMADKVIQYCQDIQEQTPWQLHSKKIDPEKQIEDMVKDYIWIPYLVPSTFTCTVKHENEAEGSALITTLALLRFKEDKGVFPDRLDELIKAGYIKELPQDPYNDGPLTYKKADDNFILYSFGADFDDDGGTYSIWGQDEKGGDQVFWPIKAK